MRACANCGKTSLMAGTRKLLRGHYNPTNWSRKYPNLQKTKLPNGKRALVCTQCLKSLTKPTPKMKVTNLNVAQSAPVKAATLAK